MPHAGSARCATDGNAGIVMPMHRLRWTGNTGTRINVIIVVNAGIYPCAYGRNLRFQPASCWGLWQKVRYPVAGGFTDITYRQNISWLSGMNRLHVA